jgi:nicotinamide-nucleotide amidase
MRSIILSVGDELVLGQTVDTNSAWMSQQLAAAGCEIVGHQTVADDQPAIEAAILDSARRCDFLIVSGGIGPTPDDLTRQALAAALGVELDLNEAWLERIRTMFRTRLGKEMPPMNAIQARVPRGATMIDNPNGTACGIDAVYQSGDLKNTCRIFVMPGVPKEMKGMFTASVLPVIAASGGGAAIRSATLHTFGMGESAVAERLGELMKRGRNPSVGTTVANGIVSLRVNSRFGSVTEAQAKLDETVAACHVAVGDLIYGRDGQSLPAAVLALMKTDRNATVATAESCTGGLLAKMLTDEPGSSAHFKQGWVTYSNLSKYERLGVPEDVINVYGAVSEPVVEKMAKAARRLAKADFALAISGVAGPDGGSATKPVGTVCICLAVADPADKQNSFCTTRTFHFPGDREMVRDRSAKMALTMLRSHLLGNALPV